MNTCLLQAVRQQDTQKNVHSEMDSRIHTPHPVPSPRGYKQNTGLEIQGRLGLQCTTLFLQTFCSCNTIPTVEPAIKRLPWRSNKHRGTPHLLDLRPPQKIQRGEASGARVIYDGVRIRGGLNSLPTGYPGVATTQRSCSDDATAGQSRCPTRTTLLSNA